MTGKFGKSWAAAGLCSLLAAPGFAADPGGKPDTDAGNKTEAQISFACQLFEMPAATVKTLFEAQGAAPGRKVTVEDLQRLAQNKEANLLSAPRIITLPGQSAQIKVCEQRSFATNFKVVANGAWEPVFTPSDIGLTMTVMANPYPNDPERLQGIAEVSLTRLVAINEQKVIPPGQKEPLTLQLPVIDCRKLTTAFAVNSGETIVLGNLDRTDGDQVKSTVVLLLATSMSPAAELIAKLKAWIVPTLDFKEASFAEVIQFLAKRSKELDPEQKGVNIMFVADKLTTDNNGHVVSIEGKNGGPTKISLTLKNIPLYEAFRYVAQVAGVSVKYEKNLVTFRLP